MGAGVEQDRVPVGHDQRREAPLPQFFSIRQHRRQDRNPERMDALNLGGIGAGRRSQANYGQKQEPFEERHLGDRRAHG